MGTIAWAVFAIFWGMVWVALNLIHPLLPTWLWIVVTPFVTSTCAFMTFLFVDVISTLQDWIASFDAYRRWWKYSKEIEERLERIWRQMNEEREKRKEGRNDASY